jgi:hypothetical protein
MIPPVRNDVRDRVKFARMTPEIILSGKFRLYLRQKQENE